MGEAIATPIDNANHTSTKRAIRWALRRVCMVRIIAAHFGSRLVSCIKLFKKAVICHRHS
jgi:polysaccharide deacetylase 2 family uncharacterized protein YibQ